MRLYDTVSGIIVILSIIDFAVAAPVPVQEKRQACVDVVHIPRDAIAVLGKRGDEELDKSAHLLEENLKTWRKPVESSDAHASSSSAPAGPDLGSTNVVQTPAPNPAPLTANPNPSTKPWDPSSIALESSANPNPLMEPSSPSSKGFDSASLSDSSEYETSQEFEGGNSDSDESHGPLHTQTSSGHGLDHELTEAPAPQSNPKKRPWTDPDGPGPDPDFDWNYWMNLEDPPPKRPALSKEFGQANEYQVEHAQQPNPSPTGSGFHSSDPDLDTSDSDLDPVYHSVIGPVHPLSTVTGWPTEPAPEAVKPLSWIPGWPTEPTPEAVKPLSWIPGSSTQFEYEGVNRLPPSPELTDPELHSDHQSSSTDSQPVDLLAAIYAAKGKAKESRRISGTRDVGNAAQRGLQSDKQCGH
jgi:hypothetical protein